MDSVIRRFTAVFSRLAVVGIACASCGAAQITITKTAAEANPGIYLAEFSGPAEMRDLLLRSLAQCDWFTVVNNPAAATYSLSAAYSAAPVPALDLKVTGGAPGSVTFRQTTRSTRHGWVVYQAVDTLITRLFKNPGLCASSLAFANGKTGTRKCLSAISTAPMPAS